MSFTRKHAVAISGPQADRETIMKRLNSYSKEKLMKVLKELESGGPALLQSLNVENAVAEKLGHPDPEVQTAAVTVVGLLGHKAQKFEEWLWPMQGSPSVEVRAAVVETLGRLGPFLKNQSAVTSNAVDEAPLVRVKVCHAIAEMEATLLHETVAGLLNDPVPEVQNAALESLGALISLSLEMQSTYATMMGQAVDMMLADPRTKSAALDAVAAMGTRAPSSCVSGVAAALSDSDGMTRMSAVAAVGAIADAVVSSKGTLEKMTELLKSEDAGVKAAAANALGALGDKASSSAGAVAELLGDTSEDTSGLALVMGGGGRRLPPHMRRPKCAAVSALGRIGDEAHMAKISEALNDKEWEVRLCAAEALATFGSKAKSEVSALMGCLEDDTFPVRAMACFALGQIGDSEALPRLIEAFEDSAFTVRLYAVQAVGLLGEAAEEHCHDVFKLTNDSVSDVKAAAVVVLSKLGENAQNYACVVSTMVTDEDAVVRAAACESLAGMGSAGAQCLAEIEDLVSDPMPIVREAAIAAIESFGGQASPLAKDFGKGPGVPNDRIPYWKTGETAGVLLPGEVSFEGLGLYFNDILAKKHELVQSGKWIEGVL